MKFHWCAGSNIAAACSIRAACSKARPGTLDNFQLGVGVSQGDFYSPRHRHNFEQIRVQLDGALSYDRDGVMSAGIVGYFPEGVFYGPQSQKPEDVATAAVLQFGGASGSGYLSNKETRAAMEELNKLGEFKDGVFRRREAFSARKMPTATRRSGSIITSARSRSRSRAIRNRS